MKQLCIFQEHGGALYTEVGRARITFFAHQIDIKENNLVMMPTSVQISLTEEEREVFKNFKKPITPSHVYSKARSIVYEICSLNVDGEEKKKLLESLKKEINSLIKKI
ncbi:hypothetical protein HCH_03783 [Hahella chejuensis KCTC 2396]|uniref:Uncharacterized protein n=1 Tax=Hahella chejuensis (strain KCTC 2396) TaxID=349521 RepID=Q2SFQ9_HAHCH|nr:hypothetical protein [Hahella chejuensis]ABC30515.1 hypothetical protein HCH_03783 [Hahella chejuensis KCTC 2396]